MRNYFCSANLLRPSNYVMKRENHLTIPPQYVKISSDKHFYQKEVYFMLWKMTNVVLQKGSVFPFYGDSAPFFKSVCHRKGSKMKFR